MLWIWFLKKSTIIRPIIFTHCLYISKEINMGYIVSIIIVGLVLYGLIKSKEWIDKGQDE